eukprot:NODE_154_length_15322_cov_0.584510.p10 type:complete len:280 gc:universal NODE_154_length_15322_cov_0.584510:11875-12714(+)
MDTMPFLGFPVYPVQQFFTQDYMDFINVAPQLCLSSTESGVHGKSRSNKDIALKLDECPFRPFGRKRNTLFYLKKYLNGNSISSMDPKYIYEIRSYEHDMSVGVSLNDDGTWVAWNDNQEYAYLVDRELPNDSATIKIDTIEKQSIAFEAIGFENDLNVVLTMSPEILMGFRSLLLRTQCFYLDQNNYGMFADCNQGTVWTSIALPIYNPPGMVINKNRNYDKRLNYVNTKERPIPPFITGFPFRNGINIFYNAFPGCLVIATDTNGTWYDFDIDKALS